MQQNYNASHYPITAESIDEALDMICDIFSDDGLPKEHAMTFLNQIDEVTRSQRRTTPSEPHGTVLEESASRDRALQARLVLQAIADRIRRGRSDLPA